MAVTTRPMFKCSNVRLLSLTTRPTFGSINREKEGNSCAAHLAVDEMMGKHEVCTSCIWCRF